MKPSKNTLPLLIILTSLCHSDPAHALEPAIEYTDIPAFGTTDPLKGQAGNIAPADYSVAVYIYVSGWWTKPTTAKPLTAINSDGSWECDCIRADTDLHATRFAAFLVPSSYSPPTVSGSPELPEELYSNAAAHTIQSRAAGRQLDFSGYQWWVKDTFGSTWGPGPNYFSSSTNNVWVDADGRLHLRVTKEGDKWLCAEVVSMRSFGYGTYRAYVDTPTEAIDLNAILGLFTWSDSPAYAYREIDVEISRWGDEEDKNNAQFVVQPWTTPGNLKRFRIPATQSNTTHGFKWTPKNIKFISYENHYKSTRSGNNTCKSWTYSSSGVPKAGDENFRMNLWLSEGIAPSDGEEMEVIISRFEFIPL